MNTELGARYSTRWLRSGCPIRTAPGDSATGTGRSAICSGPCNIVDLEASIPLANEVTLAVGGQNIFDVFSDRMDLFAAEFGLPYSQFTPWGLSGGYYYARINYQWGH